MSTFDLIIRGGMVVRETGVERADIAVAGEKIVEIAPEIAGDARETIDATGLHVFPGLIDPHVHFNEPGRTEWEGFATGSSALAAGGGTLFFDMPLNSSPPVLDGPSFDLKLEAARKSSYTDFALWGGLTPNNLDKMEELADRGVVGFKAFMCDSGIDDFPMADDWTLYQGMKIASDLGLIVAVHAEDQFVTSQRAAELQAAGKTSLGDYLASRPPSAELTAVMRAIAFANDAHCKLHIVHVSSEMASSKAHVAASMDAYSYETCPHFIVLNESDAVALGAVAKCAPPLRTERDNDHFDFVLSTDEITFVASDHSPAPLLMKTDPNFFKVWGGIAGIQSTLPILLSLNNPRLRLPNVARLTATKIARRFKIQRKGKIDLGFDADFALVDIDKTYTLQREDLLDRHKLSPYVGRAFRGKIVRTILRGRTIFQDGKVIGTPQGRFVRPVRSPFPSP